MSEESNARREFRLPQEVKVQIVRGDLVQTYLCKDLSSGGLFIRSENDFRHAERIELRIFLPGVPGSLSMQGEVVRIVYPTEDGGIAVRFLEQNRKLQRYCEENGAEVMRRSGNSILLVKQNEDTRYFLRTILAIDGYRVLDCANLDEAMKILATEKIDLLVADPLVRVVDGATLLEWLETESGPKCQIILLADGEVVGGGAQAYPVVNEPVHIADFRSLVSRMLDTNESLRS